MAQQPGRIANLNRYRQIVAIMVQYGFGDIAGQLGLLERFALAVTTPAGETPPERSPENLRRALADLGPVYVKLGQLLSTRPDLLPPDYILELAHLQDDAPALPFDTVRTIIERELDAPLETHFQFVDSRPLGAASLAQVHVARLRNGEPVVIKVQRPDITAQIETDLDILRDLVRLIEPRLPMSGYVDIRAVLEDFATLLEQELDFEQEAHFMDIFRANFRGNDEVVIPRVHWQLTTPRILVMQQVTGIKIDDVERLELGHHDRREIAKRMARIVLKEVLLDGIYHADPHPGNLLVMRDDVIGIVDFGIVGWLDARVRRQLADLITSIVQNDMDTLVNRLIQLDIADTQIDREALSRDIGRLTRKYYGRSLRRVTSANLMQDLMPLIQHYHLRIPTDLWLLFKTLIVIQGVGQRLDPQFNLFADTRRYMIQLSLRQYAPATLRESAVRASISLSDLINTAPDLLRMVQNGELKVLIELTGLDELFTPINGIINRVNSTILLASVILGLSLLIPRLNQDAPLWFIGFVGFMFVAAVLLAMLLVWNTIRRR